VTRTADRPIPPAALHPIDPDAPIARWRYRPRFLLELLPQAAYVWDDADPDVVWDDTTPERIWDAPFIASGFQDAVCDWVTCDIDPGEPDDLGLFPPISATLTLDNRTGAYTPWTADGRLVYWAPGRELVIYATDNTGAGADWWLFRGRVASWQLNADATVTVVAYDGLANLAQELGGDWTPGAAGDTVTQRLTKIATAGAYSDPLRSDVGTVTLSTAPTDRPPLEEMQRAALSDGGIFAADADGTLVYRNRLWRAGRDDQTQVWTISDNVCEAPLVVWDPEMAADDDGLATDVRLVNAAGLVAAAALPAGSLWSAARYRLTHPDPDLWQTQTQGNDLAAYLLAQHSTPSMAVRAFDVHVQDPRQQPAAWDFAVRTRRGDLVNVVHDFPDPQGAGAVATLDVFGIVVGVGHNLTPDAWVSHLGLTRTVDWRPVELWDRTRFPWDDPDPKNVWRY
jgi:hypothetical protein